jgi:hypothetical protein
MPHADNVKWIAKAGNLEVYIVELKPELRRVKWVAESGGGDSEGYVVRKLATPYVVLAVPFVAGKLHPQLELFYRTEPLRSLDDGGSRQVFACFRTLEFGAHVASGRCRINLSTDSHEVTNQAGG